MELDCRVGYASSQWRYVVGLERQGWRREPPRHGPCGIRPAQGFRPAFSSRQKPPQKCSTAL